MSGKELKWHQLAHHQLMSQQGPHFSPHSKPGNKWFKCCSVHFSLLRENPYEEVDEYVNFYYYYYYEKIAGNDGFWRALEMDFCFVAKARKVTVDFKFDALYR